MKFSIYSGSSQTSSGSTDGGGGSGSGKSIFGPFTFWTPSQDMPTTYRNMCYAIGNWSGSGQAVMNAGIKVGSAGTISNLSALINGGTSGATISFQVYKNNVATGLIVSGVGTDGTTTPLSQAPGTLLTFAIGDTISVYIMGNATNVNQSFDAFIEWTLT